MVYIYSLEIEYSKDQPTVVGGISNLAIRQAYSYLSAIDKAINGSGASITLVLAKNDTKLS